LKENLEVKEKVGNHIVRRKNGMMTEERFKQTNWKMSYEEYKKCYCPGCNRKDCPHREAFRRVPVIDGGLGLCPNLNGK
jgi:hypothetical protein